MLMQHSSQPSRSDPIESTVVIGRPVHEVFDFYRDFRNLPSFLGDVMAIELRDSVTSRWTIEGPLGLRVHWTITVTEDLPNELIRYQTAGSHTSWEIHFSPGRRPGSTEVREVLWSPLGRFGRAVLALIGKFPNEEVAANLRRLKQVLETGQVTDVRYAVPGKFGRG
jgi:uncharacterized membrane protein